MPPKGETRPTGPRPLIIDVVSKQASNVRFRIAALLAALIAANLLTWAWALAIFHQVPMLLGSSLLAYGFGLRHAVDADHIAAIDNMTRKLMQQGKRPVSVGLYFSLGHSTVVVLASIAIAATATAFRGRFAGLESIGSVVSTLVSALFLLGIAAMNSVVLVAVHRSLHRIKAGESHVDEDLDMLLAGGGLLARLFRPLFRSIRQSWHMYPLGFLFGLGFDTATEIGLLGISAIAASQGLSIWSILVFPVLFAAGMSLVDTSDGMLMLAAYGWAFRNPIRKLYYNMTITLLSVLVALAVGGIEVLGLIGGRLGLAGAFWNGISVVNNNFATLGYLIIALFIGTWCAASLAYRRRSMKATSDQ